MKLMNITFENCYGIRQLTHTFAFDKARAYSIYAPNGFMKTSFAKIFSDLSNNKTTRDLVFPDRVSKREIKDENNTDISGENVFVIEPYIQNFNSDKTSLLLVNKKIKKGYDEALLKIEEKKTELVKKLKQLSGLTGRTVTPENELLKVFGENSIFDLLESLNDEIIGNTNERLSSIVYSELFNDKTIAFIESGQIKTQLKEYIDRYNDLVDKSPVLSKSFNHYHAKTIHKNLSENGFFSANHSVNLFNGKEKEELTTPELLEEKIEYEKKRIFSDEGLSKAFDSIDQKITNADLRKFRDYLFDNRDIVAELSDYKKLQKDIWKAYLKDLQELLGDLLEEYKIGKKVIKAAVITAKKEKTEWEEVVNLFNQRFSVPFKIAVSNQDEVILNGSSPQICFTFFDDQKSAEVDRDSLLKVLSQGERRALYILNILFELNIREKTKTETLLIVDDIADSFDYKNKYAIVEYLKDISESATFFSIFLTHNFDFHRTLSGRLGIPRENKFFAVKNNWNLSLSQEKYQKNPFEYWKNNFHNQRFVISAIPFIRNLAEYCGWSPEYQTLTSLLHLKSDTKSINVKDLEGIYRSILKDCSDLLPLEPDKIITDLIFEISDEIVNEPDETAELESKIVLSISIRLQAEEFMIKKIQDEAFVNSITKNQTVNLLQRFKADFPHEVDGISLVEKVNLMTPENIHINSFMYEPILDMASGHLKELYTKVKQLNA